MRDLHVQVFLQCVTGKERQEIRKKEKQKETYDMEIPCGDMKSEERQLAQAAQTKNPPVTPLARERCRQR